MPPEYDASRATYSLTRRTDPHIAAAIERALGDARSVVNVGAGTGSYESPGREVIAVEPSATMRDQREPAAAKAIAARAEALPLDDDSVDAALAALTVHHWDDPRRGLTEMRRVARRRVVVFTHDPAQAEALWLVRDYLPEIASLDQTRFMEIEDLVEALGGAETSIERLPIPHDCRDGFLGAFWRRPERYLDPAVLPGNSAFMALPPEVLERGLAKLRNDIDSGAWRRRYGGLLSRDQLDVGYRLVIAELG
jgi:ubiquinone/menaquinone biosynthesis C-methylase UbiE